MSEAGKSQVPTCGKEHTDKYRNQDGCVDDAAPLSYRGLFERTIDQKAVMVANECCNTKEKKKSLLGKQQDCVLYSVKSRDAYCLRISST